jgi:hypothetical protein
MSKKPVVGKRQKPNPTRAAVAEDGQLARSSVPPDAARAAATGRTGRAEPLA